MESCNVFFNEDDTITFKEGYRSKTISVDKFFIKLEKSIKKGKVYSFEYLPDSWQWIESFYIEVIDKISGKLLSFTIDLNQKNITEVEKKILNDLKKEANKPTTLNKRKEYIKNTVCCKMLLRGIKKGHIFNIEIDEEAKIFLFNFYKSTTKEIIKNCKYQIYSDIELEVVQDAVSLSLTPDILAKVSKINNKQNKKSIIFFKNFIKNFKEQKKSNIIIGWGFIASLFSTIKEQVRLNKHKKYHLSLAEYKKYQNNVKEYKKLEKESKKIVRKKSIEEKIVEQLKYLYYLIIGNLDKENEKKYLELIYKEYYKHKKIVEECKSKRFEIKLTLHEISYANMEFLAFLLNVEKEILTVIKENEKETIDMVAQDYQARLNEEQTLKKQLPLG